MPGKALTEEGLQKDLAYVLGGIDCHAVLAKICPPKYGLQVIEPGCGSGKLGIWYALRGAAVWLLDIDGQAIEYAKRLWEMANHARLIRQSYSVPSFQVGSIHNLPFPDNWADFCYNEGVPHHWGYNPHDWRRQHAINEMVRVTKPGGSVCVIGSNAHCPETMKMAETTHHLYPGMPPCQKPFTREELAARLGKAGLEYVETAPVSGHWLESPLLAGWGRKP